MSISLSMIVKDEALTIERTINSARSIVSEVVVGLDAASSDGTRAILERLGCKIISSNLTAELAAKATVDDSSDWGFSKARNRVFEACNPDNWRLILDGHEILRDPDALAAEVKAAADKNGDCVDVRIAFEPGPDGIPQTMFESTRVVAPHVRYNNPQHNVAVVDNRKRHAAYHIVVEHRKRDQAPAAKKARDAQRSSATVAGFEKVVRDNPKAARSWFYLAAAYRENARYTEAVNAYTECLAFSRWNEERWHARMELGRCLVALGRVSTARDQFAMAIDEFPVMAEAYYYLGDLAYKQQRYREAEVWLSWCARMPMPSCRLFLNPRIYMVDRHDLLAMVYHHLGQPALAAEQAERALQAAPNARIQRNLELWRGPVSNAAA